MSVGIVTEYSSLGDANGKVAMAPAEPYLASAAVTFTTSTQSAAFQAATNFVLICAIDALHYAVGPNPTADTDDPYLPAGGSRVIGVTPGDKIALVNPA